MIKNDEFSSLSGLQYLDEDALVEIGRAVETEYFRRVLERDKYRAIAAALASEEEAEGD